MIGAVIAMGMILMAKPAVAEVQLAAYFADNLVIQRGVANPCWGTASPGETVKVMVLAHSITVRADADGRWEVRLPAMKARDRPFELTVSGAKNTVTVHNILAGDVWLCAGQSNMQKPIGPWPGQQPVLNYAEEIATANYPSIRLFKVDDAQAFVPQTVFGGRWEVCSPQTAGGFSATAYFFARQLLHANHVPIRLVVAAVGGTQAQCWTDIQALKRTETYRGLAEREEELVAFAHTDRLLPSAEMSAYAERYKRRWWQEHDPGLVKDDKGKAWNAPDYDDSMWQTMEAPKNLWTYVGLPDFEGMVWFRRTIDVPADWNGKDLLLSFSGYSGEMSTYFNGVNIDDLRVQENPDLFKLSASLVRAGKNVLAVRISGENGAGGILGDPANIYLARIDHPDKKIMLAGAWPYRVGLSLQDVHAFPTVYNLAGTLYNAMIHPLARCRFKGVLWYQGESDMTGGIHQPYRDVLEALIANWRALFERKDLPFLVVQLPNVGQPTPDPTGFGNYARVREAQLAAVLHTPYTGLITTIDIGEPDIHPRNKQDVGKRLALMAQALAYGKRVEGWGPIYAGLKAEGHTLRLRFLHAAGGLMTRDGGLPKGFAVAGKDGGYVEARAIIEGDTVVVSAAQVPEPTIVRYATTDNPLCNLINRVGLPASPFRTDCADTIATDVPVKPKRGEPVRMKAE